MAGKKNQGKKTAGPEPEKTSGANISYWIDSVKPIEFSPLNENTSADVVIVGGGISGMTAAYLLSREGKSVIVAEDGYIGSGETGRTTAHLSNALDDRYYDIEKYFGQSGSRLAAESHSRAIDMIERIANEEMIDCDFERLPGYLFLHPTDTKESLQKEYEAALRAGLMVSRVQGIPGIPVESGPGILFPGQAKFHPLKYLSGLCSAVINRNGKIFTNTHVSDVDRSGVLTDTGFKISAKDIIVATNSPINNKYVIHTKIAPYRTYVIAAMVPKDSLPRALWWDTGDQDSTWPVYPYHYVRTQTYDGASDLLIIGGEDHKTAQAAVENLPENERYYHLETWARKRFPMMSEIFYRWSGQVIEPYDSLAYIGKNPADSDNIYIATGDSGNGMTHGTIAGMLLSDLIMGISNPWRDLYDPSRKTLRAAGDFIEEQANVAKQYKEYLTGEDFSNSKQLVPGMGAIIRNGTSKAAIYKDEKGKLYAFSAVCPHLKCIIEWNDSEKTFDCPCHGSRFTCFGKVVNGPANINLEEIGIPEQVTQNKFSS